MGEGIQSTSRDELLTQLFRENLGYVSRKQAVESGIDPHLLLKWVNDGRAERVQPGLYRSTSAPPFTHDSLVEVAYRVPHGVICLRSALAFHEIGTVSPAAIDIAIPNKAWKPKVDYPPINFYYFSEPVYQYGIEEHSIGTATLRVYSPEKTLADLLYFRNKIGLRVFTEALKDYMGKPGANLSEVMRAAKVRRVNVQMHQYLEVLV